jgi:large conductance mechanosensitive channel
MGMLKEFKEFAMKGSLIDTAVAFVMGVVFGKVTTSFIDGVVMPVVGNLIGLGDFSKAAYELSPEVKDAAGKITAEAVSIKYGAFVTACIDFILVAFVMFMIVKAINKMKKEAPPAPAEPSSTDKLLMEIRDSLKK